jgi:hypothetical protein
MLTTLLTQLKSQLVIVADKGDFYVGVIALGKGCYQVRVGIACPYRPRRVAVAWPVRAG